MDVAVDEAVEVTVESNGAQSSNPRAHRSMPSEFGSYGAHVPSSPMHGKDSAPNWIIVARVKLSEMVHPQGFGSSVGDRVGAGVGDWVGVEEDGVDVGDIVAVGDAVDAVGDEDGASVVGAADGAKVHRSVVGRH